LIVFLNGAFGVGKTVVARHLRRRLPASAIYDPELLGFVLQRLPRLAPRDTEDFQDLPLWRRGSVRGIQLVRTFRPTVLVPMTFSNLDYLREILSGVQRFDSQVRHFCLTAPLAVVEARLARRGSDPTHRVTAWQLRRAAECCAAHAAPEFSEHVATDHRDVREVAMEIEARLRAPLAERPLVTGHPARR
jgi:hypothetical protein